MSTQTERNKKLAIEAAKRATDEVPPLLTLTEAYDLIELILDAINKSHEVQNPMSETCKICGTHISEDTGDLCSEHAALPESKGQVTVGLSKEQCDDLDSATGKFIDTLHESKGEWDADSVARIVEHLALDGIAYKKIAAAHNAALASERQKREEVEAEEVRRIKHLNRLGSWAQQDPTGPLVAGDIQRWVLAELKAALGSAYKSTDWQPEYLKLRDKLASEIELREEAEKLIEGARQYESIRNGDLVEKLDKMTAAHKLASQLYEKSWKDLNTERAAAAKAVEALREIKLHSDSALTFDLPSTESMDIEGSFEQLRDIAATALAFYEQNSKQ